MDAFVDVETVISLFKIHDLRLESKVRVDKLAFGGNLSGKNTPWTLAGRIVVASMFMSMHIKHSLTLFSRPTGRVCPFDRSNKKGVTVWRTPARVDKTVYSVTRLVVRSHRFTYSKYSPTTASCIFHLAVNDTWRIDLLVDEQFVGLPAIV